MQSKYLFWLLVLLPSGLLAQTVSPASARHAQTVQQMQRYYPQATPVDIAELQAKQADDHKNCSSCAKQQQPQHATATTPASQAQLLAQHERLQQHLQHLQDAEIPDRALIQKYSIALQRNRDQLRRAIERDRKAAQQPAR